MRRVLLSCATALEAEPVLERVQALDAQQWPGGIAVHSGKLSGVPCDLVVTGVGKAAAASGTAAALASQSGAYGLCVSVGLAGVYTGEFIPVGSTVVAAEEIDLDGGALSASGRTPLADIGLARLSDGPTHSAVFDLIEADPKWRDLFAVNAGVMPLRVATSDAVSADLDAADARRLASGAAVEAMEGHAVALTALRFGVPFAEVRAVSNAAGVRDKSVWQIRGPLRRLAGVLADTLKAHSP